MIVVGLAAAVVALVLEPAGLVSVVEALHLAGATGRLQTFDFSFDLTEPIPSGRAPSAALFLFCSYFGTRPEPGAALPDGAVDRRGAQSLLMSAYWKIPLQALILIDRRAAVPLLSLRPAAAAVQPRARRRDRAAEPRRADMQALERRFAAAFDARQQRPADLAAAQRPDDRRAHRAAFSATDACGSTRTCRRCAAKPWRRAQVTGRQAATTTSTTCSPRSSCSRCRWGSSA